MPTIRSFLDLSTAHLSTATRTWLDEQGRIAALCRTSTDPRPAFCMGSTSDGWLCWAGMEDDEANLQALPFDLIRCIRHAKRLGCDYILFDCDAEIDEALYVYEDGQPAHVTFNPQPEPFAMQRNARLALAHLVHARNLLIRAKATRAVERVRAALSSVKGAVRAASYREFREIDASVAASQTQPAAE